MSNIQLLPSQNNICGIEKKDNITYKYKCPANKFCNYSSDERLGICENTSCFPYNINNVNIDIKEYDGSAVLRNKMINKCDRKISINGKCGLDNNNTKCPNKECCSIKGICGYDKESCMSISPYYTNDIIAEVNRNYYSNYVDVKNYQYEFIKKISNKYKDNNNFEISTNNKCGLDLEKEKIFKCTNDNYCDKYNNSSIDYNNFNNNNINLNLNIQDLDLNFIHGENFNNNYDKWVKKKEKIESIYNKYINNKLEISTNESCGIDLENEKIFKCSDKKFCDKNNKCSIDYNKYNNNQIFDFNNSIFKDNINEQELKKLNSNLLHGDNFFEEYNKFKIPLNTKLENQLDTKDTKDTKDIKDTKLENQLDIKDTKDTKLIQKESNKLDCNNIKTLDSFKTLYNTKNNNLNILNIIKTNKVDDKTCDIKYNFFGKIIGQNSRRVTVEYVPDIGYVCTNIDKEMSGLTTLDLNNNYRDEINFKKKNNINQNLIIIIYIIIFIIFISLVKINKYII